LEDDSDDEDYISDVWPLFTQIGNFYIEMWDPVPDDDSVEDDPNNRSVADAIQSAKHKVDTMEAELQSELVKLCVSLIKKKSKRVSDTTFYIVKKSLGT
jgi:hypothetical protein